MRFVATALVFFVAGCKDNDLIDGVPEPTPDAPLPDAGPDIGPDMRCVTPPKCETSAECDDCNDCTSDTCAVGGFCEYQDVPCGCCIVKDTPGCGNATVEACVCALPDGEICCETAWDNTCVEDVSNECAGECGCCTAHSEGGCYDAVMGAAISDCVCALDPFCCIRQPAGTGWDDTCVTEVVGFGCGTCP